MAVLVIMESKGDRERLLAASDEMLNRAGPADGLAARVVAPTDDGIVLVHPWESEQARERWQQNPRHREALQASGMIGLAKERTVREYETHHVELSTGGMGT